MITETDKRIYNEYKGNHDGTMEAFIEWFERGGRAKVNRIPQQHKKIYREAYNIVNSLDMTGSDIARKFDITDMDVHRLKKKRFRAVNINKAKKVVNYE